MQVALYRRFQKAVAALILVCWLPLVLPAGATANTFGVIAAPRTSAGGDAVICHCANCPGGKMCCCRHGAKKSSTHGYCFCAGCGRKVPLAAPVVVPKVLPAAPIRGIDASFTSDFVEIAAVPKPFGVSRAPSPLFLPPRLS